MNLGRWGRFLDRALIPVNLPASLAVVIDFDPRIEIRIHRDVVVQMHGEVVVRSGTDEAVIKDLVIDYTRLDLNRLAFIPDAAVDIAGGLANTG